MNLNLNYLIKLIENHGVLNYEDVRERLLVAPLTKVKEGMVNLELIGLQMAVKIIVEESIWIDFENDFLDYYGVTKERVIKDALQNTERIAPPVLYKDVHNLFCYGSDYPATLVMTEIPRYGAVAVLYKNVLNELSEMYGDVLLLTLSSHELVAHPLKKFNLEYIKDSAKSMLTDPSILELPEDERLIELFIYEKNTQTLKRIRF